MPTATINCPRTLDHETAISLCLEFEQTCKTCSKLVLDFKQMSFATPSGMVATATLIKNIVANRREFGEFKFFVSNHKSCGYARHVGFFKALSVDHETSPTNYSSSSYIPITRRNIRSFMRTSPDGRSPHDRVEARAKHVAEVLSQGDPSLDSALRYCLREMFRNIFEHSQTTFSWYGGQHWPNKDLVEFAFSDLGIGFQKSINRHPSINLTDDSKAVDYALTPGITGQPGRSIWSETSGPDWANSGYGLYIASEICRRHGKFIVHSNSSGRVLENATAVELDYFFPGTLIVLQIRPSTLMQYDTVELIRDICRDGESLAAESELPTVKKASRSSSFL